MASNTTYLITGANRGIGLQLTTFLLARPNHTVVATVRSPKTPTTELIALPKAANSILIVESLSTDETNSPAALLTRLSSNQLFTHVDVVIVNAGAATFDLTLSTSHSALTESFSINTILPISIFQTFYPLLAKSSRPKFVYVSSYLGSIGCLDTSGKSPSLAYGAAKAAAGFFVRKVHFEFEDLISMAVHPGWIKTGNGQSYADATGGGEPPQELVETVTLLLEQIDKASRDTTSGKLVVYNGEIMPW